MKYYNRPEHGNGTLIVIASRGPDGDVDLDRLPYRTELLPAIRTAEGWWRAEAEFLDSDGKRRENTTVSVRLLPPLRRTGGLSQRDLLDVLAGHGISLYDPTNGSVSDGDVFFSNIQ